jgi:hypothetical protein
VRVKALNDSTQDMSEFSIAQNVDYVFRRMLMPPELIEPYDKTTVFLQKDMEPLIWLEWGSVPNALKYSLEVSNTENFSHVLISKTLTSTRFLVNEKIPYGNIFWRVRAIAQDEDLRSEWSPRQFIIYHQKNGGF